MFPSSIPSQAAVLNRTHASALNRLEFAADGGDSTMSPAMAAASIPMQLRQFGLRNNILAQDVAPRSTNSDLLTAILGRDALRDALLGLSRSYTDPLEALVAAPPRLSMAQSVQQDAIVNEAFQRGREEALLSLIRSGAISASMLQSTPAPATAPPSRSVIEQLAQSLSPRDNNSVALEALGSTDGHERRKKNAPYFDASSLEDPAPVIATNRRTRGGVTEPFPEKLHRMLRETEERGESDLVSFFPHGRAFMIHHVERFCREIMPRYFKQSRLSSFQRQLNLYGFTRITSGQDTGGYYHELFLEGRPGLVIHMRRVGIPKRARNFRAIKPVDPALTPDFYSMAPVKNIDEDKDIDEDGYA